MKIHLKNHFNIYCGYTKDEKHIGENKRMYEITNTFIGLPVIFIRYNPNNFVNKEGKNVKILDGKRHTILLNWLEKCIRNNISSSSTDVFSNLRVKYLFYD